MKKATRTDIARAYQGKNALITGGLGFIGSNLAHRLVELGARVTVMDSLMPNMGGNLSNIRGIKNRVRVNIADIRDENSTNHLVRGQDYIFNLAAQISHVDSMRSPFADLDINCRGHLTLLEACRRYNTGARIVFASTRQVYGKPRYLPVDEKHPIYPVDVNGIHKQAAEWYHLLYQSVYSLHTCSLRLTNTYGPRQLMKHGNANFIGWFVRQAIDSEEIQVFGDGQQLRDFTFIGDAVEAFLLAAASEKAEGQAFNLGGKPYTLLDFVKVLIKTAGGGSYRITPFPQERKAIDIGSTYCSHAKISETLGWAPAVSLEDGLVETIDFFKQNKADYW